MIAKPAQRVVDGRGLSPPEPLERTIAALQALPDGEELLVLLYCTPRPLYAVLDQSGYAHASTTLPDGTVEIRIRRA